jgi:hypothetical protein
MERCKALNTSCRAVYPYSKEEEQPDMHQSTTSGRATQTDRSRAAGTYAEVLASVPVCSSLCLTPFHMNSAMQCTIPLHSPADTRRGRLGWSADAVILHIHLATNMHMVQRRRNICMQECGKRKQCICPTTSTQHNTPAAVPCYCYVVTPSKNKSSSRQRQCNRHACEAG